MSLIGDSPYTRLDLPDVRPAPRLDQRTLADSSAREDALLGALAIRTAADEAAAIHADPNQRSLTRRELRAREQHWAAHWRGWAEAPHEQHDDVDYARIVACSLDHGNQQ